MNCIHIVHYNLIHNSRGTLPGIIRNFAKLAQLHGNRKEFVLSRGILWAGKPVNDQVNVVRFHKLARDNERTRTHDMVDIATGLD